MTGLELLTICLRALVYAGSIGLAGGVLFRASSPRAAAAIEAPLKRQMLGAFLLLLLVEPLRYAAFQLAVAGGDWSLAFAPELRWMAFATPIGQAAMVRLAAAGLIVAAGARRPRVQLLAALALIGSFLLEGHTAASEARLYVAPLLLVHLAAVHWWLGALFPLIAVTRHAEPGTAVATIESFGRRAVLVVGALLAAGALLALLLIAGILRLDSAYQQRLLIKLALVALLLSIAAVNKLALTPLIASDYALGAKRLRASIRAEIVVAALVLAASAWLVSTAPDT